MNIPVSIRFWRAKWRRKRLKHRFAKESMREDFRSRAFELIEDDFEREVSLILEKK